MSKICFINKNRFQQQNDITVWKMVLLLAPNQEQQLTVYISNYKYFYAFVESLTLNFVLAKQVRYFLIQQQTLMIHQNLLFWFYLYSHVMIYDVNVDPFYHDNYYYDHDDHYAFQISDSLQLFDLFHQL